jgi:hypothetical protein
MIFNVVESQSSIDAQEGQGVQSQMFGLRLRAFWLTSSRFAGGFVSV